ncbi:PAC2 family protein [Schaalia sp. lx-260]|uniref:PAC2 family protein n=1 Tax=Schaalia sp. lx-260 TaxID=2899082 RepID=UPI001E58EE44|nr:PAC2 family protein [Schaalia sp. lx-260]MCD4549230.1 PAC2 family protein [Schaalia sp. lx-260]
MPLYDQGPAWGVKSPILVLHFDGAIDAGVAGHIAVEQMRHALRTDRIATFHTDEFIDYRAHRPVLTVEDWVSTDLNMPEIIVERVDDDLGQPFLLIHGPEPDMRWEKFASHIRQIAEEAGVEITVSLHGVPAGTPHTRPAQVHIQATDSSLIPPQPQMMQPMYFPSPVSSFVQARLAESGIDGVALLGSVPFYMADRPYPAVSSAILRKLSELTGLALPVGDLERGAAEDIAALESFTEENPQIHETVQALETHYDALTGANGIAPLTSFSDDVTSAPHTETQNIGDVIEAYLANVTKNSADVTENAPSHSASQTDEESEPETETVEDVLRRLAHREAQKNSASLNIRHIPRHRADTHEPPPLPPSEQQM